MNLNPELMYTGPLLVFVLALMVLFWSKPRMVLKKNSYFCDWKGRDLDSLNNKTFLEQFSMTPNKRMTRIY